VLASGMEPGSVAAFLHENYLNFVEEDSVEDAAAACSYFSDAGPSPQPLPSCLGQFMGDKLADGHINTRLLMSRSHRSHAKSRGEMGRGGGASRMMLMSG